MELNKSQKHVFTKMCEFVNVKIENIDFAKNDWYWIIHGQANKNKNFVSG